MQQQSNKINFQYRVMKTGQSISNTLPKNRQV